VGTKIEPGTWTVTRTSRGAPDAADVVQDSKALGSSIATSGPVTLLVAHTESGLRSFMVAPRDGSRSGVLASNLGAVVGARVEPTSMLDLSRACYGRLVARASDQPASENQSGADPAKVAAAFGRGGLPPGCWVAVTLRKPSGTELRRARRWFRHRLAGRVTHYSSGSEVLIAAVSAGGPDDDAVRSALQMTASVIPGFDVDTRVARLSGRTPLSLSGAVLSAAGAGVPVAVSGAWWPWLLAGVPGFGLAVAAASGLVRSAHERQDSLARDGISPVPKKRHRPPSGPRQQIVRHDGSGRAGRAGEYPLHPHAFLVTPAMMAGIASPYHGSGAAASATAVLDLPPALRTADGPLLGYAGEVPVRISDADRWSGFAVFGIPGTGKSNIVTNLFAYDLLRRRSDAHPRPMIAFETKGEGARTYLQWLAATGTSALYCELLDGSRPSISMMPDGDVIDRSNFVVSAMVYAYGDGIGPQSKDTLSIVFPAALSVTDEIAAAAGLPVGKSWMWHADVLLGGRGDEAAVALASGLASAAQRSKDAQLADIVSRLGYLFGEKVTPSQRRTLQQAPRSKVAELAKMEVWFDPRRPRVDMETILARGDVVVINTGSPLRGGSPPDSETSNAIQAMLMYRYWHAVRSSCSGWREQGRRQGVYADELSMLAGASPEVVAAVRDQGRSYGVEPTFGCQYPDQLHPLVRATVSGYSTMVWLRQDADEIIRQAVTDVNKLGAEYSTADIAGLEPYHGILRTVVEGRVQAPFPLRFAKFDQATFAAVQGFPNARLR